MNCYSCNTELIWGGDHSYEDYSVEGEGIVTNLSCPECNSSVIVYTPEVNNTEKNENQKSITT